MRLKKCWRESYQIRMTWKNMKWWWWNWNPGGGTVTGVSISGVWLWAGWLRWGKAKTVRGEKVIVLNGSSPLLLKSPWAVQLWWRGRRWTIDEWGATPRLLVDSSSKEGRRGWRTVMPQTSRIRDFGGKKRRWFGSKLDKWMEGWMDRNLCFY